MKIIVLAFLVLLGSTTVFGKMEKAVKASAVGAATGAATMAPGAAIAAAGFTVEGVAAGSIAAVAHSAIGNVAAGSAFAALQSIGATGALFFGAPVVAGVGVVGGGLYYIFG